MSRVVRASLHMQADAGRIVDAFLVQEHLRAWWGVEQSLVQPQRGGLYVLAWGISKAGFQYITSGIIEIFEPESRLRIRDVVYGNPDRPLLGPMSLDLQVRPDRGSNLVEITQDGYGDGPDWDWYYEAVKGAWPAALGMVKEYLEKS